ncbi:MAG: hypothetical protein ABI877_14070 [Gemmatimonadaceae bacterium]
MLSRTDGVRFSRERILRSLGIVALIMLGVRLALTPPVVAPVTHVTTAELASSLARATQARTPGIRLDATRVLAPDERDWLRALDRAGSPVTWDASPVLPPLAMQGEPVVAPGGRYAVSLIAPADAPVAVRDEVGLVDSLRIGKGGVLTLETSAEGMLRASTPAGTAGIPSLDSAVVRAVLVVGPASWESKFVAAALEEAGWPVVTRLSVAPNVYVEGGQAAPLDTSRFAAVVMLDSLALRVGDVTRYLRSGGGVVLTFGAASQSGLASLAGAVPADHLRGELGALSSPDPRRGLSAIAFRVRDARSTVLERRGTSAVAVARRVGAGRVLALGTDETWRWRMQGPEGSVEAHRAWWTSAVSRVAYAPVPNDVLSPGRGLDATPLAAMHAALGPPSAAPVLTKPLSASIVDPLLLALALLSLLAEWTSRRLRGAK